MRGPGDASGIVRSRASKDALAFLQGGSAIGLVLAGLTLAFATPASACQCFNFSRAEIVQRADIVFEGTVAVVTVARGQLQATIDVQRLEKGPELTSITLLTPLSAAACGVSFQVPQRVIVAARRDGPVWRTDLCMALGLRPLPVVPSR
ncbi:MAG: hypothetical protein K2X45_17700 [Phreatobacter sp.]|nr:hypothetical protein [Phreatobacter sp.]